MPNYSSWGNIFHPRQSIYPLPSRFQSLPTFAENKILPYGMGRSYGDVCLNHDNIILPTRRLDRFIDFNPDSGVLRCEAGVSLQELLTVILPHGYFVPVTPGTRNVTLGGMVANDVHGKNHHCSGSFGCHINELTLLRSTDGFVVCSPQNNSDLFNATIGGIGLTGVVTEVEIRLKRIASIKIDQEVIPFENIGSFVDLTNESDKEWEYTVAWIDSLAGKSSLGRGIFFRGNHCTESDKELSMPKRKKLSVPFEMPKNILNPLFMRVFNKLYYRLNKKGIGRIDFDKFFYPLDRLDSWNRLYGRRGFYQYQCVVPSTDAETVLAEMLKICSVNSMGSFLSVLKKFGAIPSPGMLSFPREGFTLALDFPNNGQRAYSTMDLLDKVVLEAGGAVYPAKDARMSSSTFKAYYPKWEAFSKFIDPAFSSSFWRRVMTESQA